MLQFIVALNLIKCSYWPVDIGDGQAVQLAHHSEHGDGELVALVAKQVREVGADQDDAGGLVSVVLEDMIMGDIALRSGETDITWMYVSSMMPPRLCPAM